jgi:NAD(P)-dependent dehydrogenase (short-subunit alcohol dehydrogenase family)
VDVTSTTSISAAVQAVTQLTGGRLDILVNNARYGYMMPLLDADIAKVKANVEINIFDILTATQSFFPLLRAAGGMVVNQASIAGLSNICQPFIGSYSASKTAVVDLSNTLRVELAPLGFQVSDAAGSVWDVARIDELCRL